MLKKTYDLSSMGLTHTSNGMLYKWMEDNKYYKSGSLSYGDFSKHEPIIEVICSKYLKLLGIDGVEYWLEDIHSKGGKYFDEQIITCCVSDSFLKEEELFIPVGKHYSDLDRLTYEKIIADFPQFELKINEMLIFDFLVNNVDRHFYNFGYIKHMDSGNVRFCPIFDNGLSLYVGLTDYQLDRIKSHPYGSKKFDVARPFRTKHSTQIKIISKLPKIYLDFDENIVIDEVLKYKTDLGELRVECIIKMLKERLKYVRNLYTNV